MMKPTEIKIKNINPELIKELMDMGENFNLPNSTNSTPWLFEIKESTMEQISPKSKMAKEVEKNKIAMIDINTKKITSSKKNETPTNKVSTVYTFYFKSRKGNYGKYTLAIDVVGTFKVNHWFMIGSAISNKVANDIVSRDMFKNLTPMILTIPLNLKYTHNSTHTFTTYDISVSNPMEDFFNNYNRTGDSLEDITLLGPFEFDE